jgi:ribosomal protein L10
VSGAVMDSKALSETEVKSLKNMPTKLELITKVAVLVK